MRILFAVLTCVFIVIAVTQESNSKALEGKIKNGIPMDSIKKHHAVGIIYQGTHLKCTAFLISGKHAFVIGSCINTFLKKAGNLQLPFYKVYIPPLCQGGISGIYPIVNLETVHSNEFGVVLFNPKDEKNLKILLATIYNSDESVFDGLKGLSIGLDQDLITYRKPRVEMSIPSSSNKSEETPQFAAPITVQKFDVSILDTGLCSYYFPYVKNVIESYVCAIKITEKEYSKSEEGDILTDEEEKVIGVEVDRREESKHTFYLYLRFGMIHSQYVGLQCRNDEYYPDVPELTQVENDLPSLENIRLDFAGSLRFQ